jgi:cytochrome c5
MKFSALFVIVLSLLLTTGHPAIAADRLEVGREAYNSACAACHDTGKDGAPITRNQKDWEGRSALWEAVMFEHANKGYLGMPAKGGNARLSEYDVDAAAEYMLTVIHPELPRD